MTAAFSFCTSSSHHLGMSMIGAGPWLSNHHPGTSMYGASSSGVGGSTTIGGAGGLVGLGVTGGVGYGLPGRSCGLL